LFAAIALRGDNMIRRNLVALLVATCAAPLAHAAEEAAPATPEATAPAEATQGGDVSVDYVLQESQITLKEALLLALRNNLDIQLARLEPAVAAEAIDQARGAFDPVGGAEYGFTHAETPTDNTFQGGATDEPLTIGGDNWNWGAGFDGVLPFGLQYSSRYILDRDESDLSTSSLSRRYTAAWENALTLPLLRDFGQNDLRVRVRRGEIGLDVSEEVFRQTLTDLVSQVENNYWELSAARSQVAVAQKSLKTARDLLEQTRVQQQVGVVSRVAVTQAEAGVAERELNMILAENQAAAAQDTLLDAILAPSAEVLAERQVLPDPPTFQDYDANLEEATKEALAKRPELEQSQLTVDDAELMLSLASNQALPRFDLVAGYTMRGLSGTPKLVRETFRGQQIAMLNPNDPTLDNLATGDFGDSLDSSSNFFRSEGNQGFSALGRVEIPIGNTTARSVETQRSIELRRAQTRLKRQRQAIILDVRNAVRNINSSQRAVEAAKRLEASATEQLRAEQERLRLGDSTPFQVLQFEEDLAEAERQLIDALRGHRNAITALERSKGTLLEARGIRYEEELDR
jgi:outer membrane protein